MLALLRYPVWKMLRASFAAAMLGAGLCLLPSIAPAEQPAGPATSPRYHGRIIGRIDRVDYTNAIIYVRTSGGIRAVTVMPGTDIDVPGGGYGSIDDLHVGSQVDIDASEVAGRVIAQIIHIR
ncbi:MAG TPA: hypothetical protein VIN40_00495 [Candidatus Tyrphobacter sp.]